VARQVRPRLAVARSTAHETPGERNREQAGEVVRTRGDLEPRRCDQRLDLRERVAPLVAEEDVVPAPQEPKRGHGDDNGRSPRNPGHVLGQQLSIVGDVLEDIHQQQAVGIDRPARPPEPQRLARHDLVAVVLVAGVDAQALARARAGQHFT
jgi:hypothetical protein